MWPTGTGALAPKRALSAEFDRPGVLTRYADRYRGQSANRWLFAAAPTNVMASKVGMGVILRDVDIEVFVMVEINPRAAYALPEIVRQRPIGDAGQRWSGNIGT